ncbi:MAG: hypothetical protein ACLFNT_08450 [Spirochaetales bacterium]
MNHPDRRASALLALLLLVAATTLYAVEVDFSTTGRMLLIEDDQQFSADGTITLSHRFTQDQKITAQGLGTVSTEEDPNAFLTLFEYQGAFPLSENSGVIKLIAGRTEIVELSGFLAPLTLDGFVVGFQRPGFIVQAVATTTVLLRPEESLVLTAADAIEAEDPDRFFGPSRFVSGLIFLLPETVGRLNLSLQYINQLDGRALFGADPGDDLYTSHYLTMGVESPLGPDIFGSLQLIGNLGTVEVEGIGRSTFVGYGARGQLRSYLPAAQRPTGQLSLYFASGDGSSAAFPELSGDVSTSFAPGPYNVPWQFTGIPFANIVAAELGGSLLPLSWANDAGLRRTRLAGDTTLLYRPFDEDMGVAGTDPTSDRGFYGVLLNAEFVFSPFVDLDVTAGGDIFLPSESTNGGLFLPGSERSWRMVVEGTLRY